VLIKLQHKRESMDGASSTLALPIFLLLLFDVMLVGALPMKVDEVPTTLAAS